MSMQERLGALPDDLCHLAQVDISDLAPRPGTGSHSFCFGLLRAAVTVSPFPVRVDSHGP